MTNVGGSVKERRAGTQELIEKLTRERTEMLVLFCRVAGLEPYSTEKPSVDRPMQEMLQDFCQVLVDYIAAGHFALYERIINGTERRQAVVELAEELYPRITETTDAALDFNDKYDCEDHCEVIDGLWQDLSRLGAEIAMRIELEDRLISALQPSGKV
jgi:regulator of sigma D